MTDYKAHSVKTMFASKKRAMLEELSSLRDSVPHAPSMGEAAEDKWRNFLTEYLPNRYEVKKAFVICSNGKCSQQLDVVVFDRQYSHFVFKIEKLYYVPAEAVYAVFELKQNVDAKNLMSAADKIESVRKLVRTSIPVPQINGRLAKKRPSKIIGGLIALKSDYKPAFSASFKKNASTLRGNRKLDLIFDLENGLFPQSKQKNGLVHFLYTLLSMLQMMGNPPAINYKEYLDNCF